MTWLRVTTTGSEDTLTATLGSGRTTQTLTTLMTTASVLEMVTVFINQVRITAVDGMITLARVLVTTTITFVRTCKNKIDSSKSAFICFILDSFL